MFSPLVFLLSHCIPIRILKLLKKTNMVVYCHFFPLYLLDYLCEIIFITLIFGNQITSLFVLLCYHAFILYYDSIQ